MMHDVKLHAAVMHSLNALRPAVSDEFVGLAWYWSL